jgi:hypothetical protein
MRWRPRISQQLLPAVAAQAITPGVSCPAAPQVRAVGRVLQERLRPAVPRKDLDARDLRLDLLVFCKNSQPWSVGAAKHMRSRDQKDLTFAYKSSSLLASSCVWSPPLFQESRCTKSDAMNLADGRGVARDVAATDVRGEHPRRADLEEMRRLASASAQPPDPRARGPGRSPRPVVSQAVKPESMFCDAYSPRNCSASPR